MQNDGTLECAQKRSAPVDLWDCVGAIILPLLIIGCFYVQKPYILHWFLCPLFFCGALLGVDAVRWVRSKMDTFDPKGILALLGMHFFVVAPLLVVYYDFPSVDEVYVSDWRPRLGYMGILNGIALVTYVLLEHWAYCRPTKEARRYRVLRLGSASVVVPCVLLLAVVAHTFYIVRAGGISALIAYRTYGYEAGGQDASGFGPLMVAGRSIPILALLLLTIWRFRRQARSGSLLLPGALVVIVLGLQAFVSGAAGSRSDTAYSLLWALGIVHFLWRRISVKWIFIGLVPFLMFMYVYSFYKSAGARSFGIFTGEESLEGLEYDTRRTFVGMLVGDLSRADVQAAELCELMDKRWDYEYRWGSTYLSALYFLAPRTLWPSKPSDSEKVIAGTEILSGPGSYAPSGEILMFGSGTRSTRIYGLAGEAMLNFGVWSVPLAFGIFGVVMARLRRRMQSYRVGDARLFLAPFYIVILLLLLSHDMDNLVMQVVFNWVVPAITIYLSSQWVPIGASAAGAGALAPGARVAGIPRGAAPQTAFR